jgi:hypothetical protein
MYLSKYTYLLYVELINNKNPKFLFVLNISLDLFHYGKVLKRGLPW